MGDNNVYFVFIFCVFNNVHYTIMSNAFVIKLYLKYMYMYYFSYFDR